MQAYSDPKRADETYALPDLEIFWADAGELWDDANPPAWGVDTTDPNEPGYYYWFCFPGCMPDSDPVGPFETQAEALADARQGLED